MVGEHDPPGPPELGPCDDGVAVAQHLEVAELAQRGLDGVRDRGLIPAHRGDVTERAGEGDDIIVQVKRHAGDITVRR
nr:hypothetical protein GCM10020092_030290 [Actinoplanes digitatis]